MATIPQIFRKENEGDIATFDYFDLAEGTGIDILYGFQVDSNAGSGASFTKDYILSSQPIQSSQNNTSGSVLTADGNSFDLDFDLAPYNMPRTIKGVGYVALNVSMLGDDGGINHYAMPIAKIRKWDGTTETEIATGYAGSSEGASTNTTTKFFTCVPITIPRTQFKPGEQLRLTILGWVEAADGTGGAMDLFHQPSTSGYELKFYVPYDLDL